MSSAIRNFTIVTLPAAEMNFIPIKLVTEIPANHCVICLFRILHERLADSAGEVSV